MVLVVFMCGFVSGGCCFHQTSVQLFQKIETVKSAVKLQSLVLNRTRGYIASGFAIDERRIMTAAHFCVKVYEEQLKGNLGPIEVVHVLNSKNTGIGGTMELEIVDEKMDLCILKSDWKHDIPPLEFADSYDDVKILDQIAIIGGPQGHFPALSEGRVVTPKTSGFGREFLNNRISLNIIGAGTFGNSGGPVLNLSGKVIGVVMARELDAASKIMYAVHLETILEFLKQEYGK